MAMNTPKGLRLHIGIFGRRNVGKSSLLNAITRQAISIVSNTAGTTTDPVEKPMEMLPLGPVLFIDTAGVDDEGALGKMRVEKSRQVIDRTDLALLVVGAGDWGDFEEGLLQEFVSKKIPVVVVLNKRDIAPASAELCGRLDRDKISYVSVCAASGGSLSDGAPTEDIQRLRHAMLAAAPDDFLNEPAIAADLVGPGEFAVLVVPIDKEAPKGRLILPQVQTIRDLLDGDSYCLVVKERELAHALQSLSKKPKLVVTDSQAFLKVAADTPREIPLTGFSVLFSRFKGDLTEQVRGAMAVENLKPGDRILVAESCSHHPITDDIGRVKIPRWLTQYVGGELKFEHVQGHDFDTDLSGYKLVIHCGACTTNRRAMLSRILRCRQQNVPITNYGLVIAYSLGIFERALEPFPAALQLYKTLRAGGEV